jgi:hypothetical protein
VSLFIASCSALAASIVPTEVSLFIASCSALVNF